MILSLVVLDVFAIAVYQVHVAWLSQNYQVDFEVVFNDNTFFHVRSSRLWKADVSDYSHLLVVTRQVTTVCRTPSVWWPPRAMPIEML